MQKSDSARLTEHIKLHESLNFPQNKICKLKKSIFWEFHLLINRVSHLSFNLSSYDYVVFYILYTMTQKDVNF